jgi:hypothetical protein
LLDISLISCNPELQLKVEIGKKSEKKYFGVLDHVRDVTVGGGIVGSTPGFGFLIQGAADRSKFLGFSSL